MTAVSNARVEFGLGSLVSAAILAPESRRRLSDA